jgi:hypothetical protein
MGRLVVDSDQLQKLEGGQRAADVCDDTGRVLGRFVPQDEYVRMMYEIERAQPSDADARQLGREDFAAGRCVTTEELLRGLDEIDRTFVKAP